MVVVPGVVTARHCRPDLDAVVPEVQPATRPHQLRIGGHEHRAESACDQEHACARKEPREDAADGRLRLGEPAPPFAVVGLDGTPHVHVRRREALAARDPMKDALPQRGSLPGDLVDAVEAGDSAFRVGELRMRREPAPQEVRPGLRIADVDEVAGHSRASPTCRDSASMQKAVVSSSEPHHGVSG